jgi:NAD(P)-dependent dehydrogenase (short-subunit alcohol dehydrogenase family)
VEIDKMLAFLWKRLKVWRRFGLGPIALLFKFERSIQISSARPPPRTAYPSLPSARIREGGFAQVHSHATPPRDISQRSSQGTAVIVGVGPGFGYALARRLVSEGFDVVLISRDATRLDPLVADLKASGQMVASYGGDSTDERTVESLFKKIVNLHGIPSLTVYSIQEFGPGQTMEVELPAFESAWRHNCLGAFLVSRAAARAMKPIGRGTILLVGSTSSILGRAGHLNLAVGKFGQRALAQVLSRELWPLGIHVAHVIIDADIAETHEERATHPQSDPDDIAFSLVAVHRQPKTAWTSEIDLRPWNEKFWEHC